MAFSVAIDGPAGAGKSTLARILAEELQFLYVDTGALYRTVGLAVLQRGIDPRDEAAVTALLKELSVSLAYVEREQRVFLGEEDVSEKIRTPEVSMAASAVSAVPAVRRFLLDTQRQLAASHSVIMDGRDIGTTILPQAEVKIFLTASAESRAQRRYAELKEKGIETSFEAVLADMEKRDYDDAHRAASPLRRAVDAVLVDTSRDDLEASVQRLKEIVTARLSQA